MFHRLLPGFEQPEVSLKKAAKIVPICALPSYESNKPVTTGKHCSTFSSKTSTELQKSTKETAQCSHNSYKKWFVNNNHTIYSTNFWLWAIICFAIYKRIEKDIKKRNKRKRTHGNCIQKFRRWIEWTKERLFATCTPAKCKWTANISHTKQWPAVTHW